MKKRTVKDFIALYAPEDEEKLVLIQDGVSADKTFLDTYWAAHTHALAMADVQTGQAISGRCYLSWPLTDKERDAGDYPTFLVDKVKDELQKVIDLLESGETDTEVIQETLDEAVCGINDLQEEFDENDSEIETVARDCIGVTVAYILEWFGIPIDIEEAIRERDW